jgi:hypothetical protein
LKTDRCRDGYLKKRLLPPPGGSGSGSTAKDISGLNVVNTNLSKHY